MAEKEGIKILNQTIQDHSLNNREKYNAVCTFQVLEHVDISMLRDFLIAMCDCVKKGGLLIISVPSDDAFLSKGVNSTLNLPPHHQTRWPDKTLKEIGKILNLEIIDIHHDKISPRNKEEYISVHVSHMLTNKHRLITRKANILQRVSMRLLRMLNKKLKVSIVDRIKPYGHSVTAVYKKN